jgi:hypothetical protein
MPNSYPIYGPDRELSRPILVGFGPAPDSELVVSESGRTGGGPPYRSPEPEPDDEPDEVESPGDEDPAI